MSMMGNGGPSVLAEGSVNEKGEHARLASFVGAMAISDLVKSTLGPKGMDKILMSMSDMQQGRGNHVTVTNDGATILKSIYVDNAAAKVLVDISKAQDDEVGDGTTSVVVFAGELLRQAEQLINQKVHPMTIIQGFREACTVAKAALEASAMDHAGDEERFRLDLMNIARTTLSSKILTHDKDHFAKLAVEAVMRLKGSGNLEMIQLIQKCGGSLKDSFLDEGFILDKKFNVGHPKRIENCKILIANTPMDTDKIKIYGARVRVDSMAKVGEIEAAEKQKMANKCNKIAAHGCNLFINRQLIYNYPEQLLSNQGVASIEHADFDGVERLALVTGGEICSTFDDPTGNVLGTCELVQEIMIGEDKLIKFSGVAKGEACTIVLRGASSHVLCEAERSLHDALCVLTSTVKDSRIVYGGGCPEMIMSRAVEELAAKTPGKRSLAMECFAKALRMIPTIICDNAGLDSSEIVSQLKAHHADGAVTNKMGIDIMTGSTGDMEMRGITECFRVKQQILLSGTEAAEMIIRVDDIIKCVPRQREQ